MMSVDTLFDNIEKNVACLKRGLVSAGEVNDRNSEEIKKMLSELENDTLISFDDRCALEKAFYRRAWKMMLDATK